MSRKFRGFRVDTLRLQKWDYGRNSAYFVTINTTNKVRYFGRIAAKQMLLSEAGKIAHNLIEEMPKKFPYVDLGEYVVMPDHVHIMIIINKPGAWPLISADTPQTKPGIKTGGFARSKNPMLNDNLPRILRWYKGRATYEIRKFEPNFEWKTRYYDRVVRDQRAFLNISRYIQRNPSAWKG